MLQLLGILLYTKQLPNYLPKNSFTTLVIGFVRLNEDTFVIPYSNSFKKNHKKISIKIPPILLDKKIKEIRIIPKFNARFFEVQYTYEVQEEQRNLDKNHALAIDFGMICTLSSTQLNYQHFFL